MDPDVDRRNRQNRLKAGRDALPADHQAALLLLEPGKGALRLESWDPFFDRSAPVFPHSHETKTPLSRSGRKKTPLTFSGLKKMDPESAFGHALSHPKRVARLPAYGRI